MEPGPVNHTNWHWKSNKHTHELELTERDYLTQVLQLGPIFQIVDRDNIPYIHNVVANAVNPRDVEFVSNTNKYYHAYPSDPVGNQYDFVLESTWDRINCLEVQVCK